MTNGAEYQHPKKCETPFAHNCSCDQPYIQQIRHQKCPVIKLVREQMGKLGGCKLDDLNRCNTLWSRIWQRRKYILSLLLLLLLIWLVLMYGVFLGASLCGTSPYKRKLPGFGIPTLTPAGSIGNAY